MALALRGNNWNRFAGSKVSRNGPIRLEFELLTPPPWHARSTCVINRRH